MDEETGEITATELTDNATDDASQVEPPLGETDGPVQTVGGDGAYDKWKAYEAIAAIGAKPVIPPQRNAKIKGVSGILCMRPSLTDLPRTP